MNWKLKCMLVSEKKKRFCKDFFGIRKFLEDHFFFSGFVPKSIYSGVYIYICYISSPLVGSRLQSYNFIKKGASMHMSFWIFFKFLVQLFHNIFMKVSAMEFRKFLEYRLQSSVLIKNQIQQRQFLEIIRKEIILNIA